ncbi:hypothetical protein Lser_V15G41775 [Lactuca serriola]
MTYDVYANSYHGFDSGVEVRSGEAFEVKLRLGRYLHIKQVCLGENKEEVGAPVIVKISVGDKVVEEVTLYNRKQPLQLLLRVYNKKFEISHTLSSGSVHFIGSVTKKPIYIYDVFESDTEEEEETTKSMQTSNSTPTTKECMDIVECFPGFEEDSLGYLQALHVFLKPSARENFMVPKADTTKMMFLKMLIQEQTANN